MTAYICWCHDFESDRWEDMCVHCQDRSEMHMIAKVTPL